MTDTAPVTPRTPIREGVNRIAYCSFHDECYHVDGETWREAAAPSATEALRAEIRGMLADLLVTLDAPNPRLALQTAIESIDYRLAHFEYIASRTPAADSPEEGA